VATSYLFHGGRLLDPRRDGLIDGAELLVEGDRIKEVSDRPIGAASATRIDLRGRTLMPGLIDAHVHLLLAEVDPHLLDGVPLTLLAAKGAASAKAMLMRWFTTIRDTGGADFGMKAALDSGLFVGPRAFIAGAPISQTGGHGDFAGAPRPRSNAPAARWLARHHSRRSRRRMGRAQRNPSTSHRRRSQRIGNYRVPLWPRCPLW
jgi:imidazolonepropionase-like amidohydrolase